jgi:hypothetical protein
MKLNAALTLVSADTLLIDDHTVDEDESFAAASPDDAGPERERPSDGFGGQARAHEVLADQCSFALGDATWDEFVALLDAPASPDRRLVELFSRPPAHRPLFRGPAGHPAPRRGAHRGLRLRLRCRPILRPDPERNASSSPWKSCFGAPVRSRRMLRWRSTI